MALLLEPLAFEFFRHALWAALLVGALCGLMGVFMVLRGMSYIGHGLSHAAFGGAVVGYLLKINFYVSAAIAALGAALLVDRIVDGKRVRADAAIGIVTTALFAVGVALISLKGQFTRSFEAALFGNILGVTQGDLWVILVVTLVCSLAIAAFYRPLFFVVFDEETAEVFGVPRRRIRLLFACLLALCVIAAMNIVGVTMIAATLIVPAASMRMVTDSFHRMVLVSPLLGALVGVIGMYLSYFLDAASGATIVITGALCFCLFWCFRLYRDRYRFHVHAHRHGGVVHVHPHTHEGEHQHEHRH